MVQTKRVCERLSQILLQDQNSDEHNLEEGDKDDNKVFRLDLKINKVKNVSTRRD